MDFTSPCNYLSKCLNHPNLTKIWFWWGYGEDDVNEEESLRFVLPGAVSGGELCTNCQSSLFSTTEQAVPGCLLEGMYPRCSTGLCFSRLGGTFLSQILGVFYILLSSISCRASWLEHIWSILLSLHLPFKQCPHGPGLLHPHPSLSARSSPALSSFSPLHFVEVGTGRRLRSGRMRMVKALIRCAVLCCCGAGIGNSRWEAAGRWAVSTKPFASYHTVVLVFVLLRTNWGFDLQIMSLSLTGHTKDQ